MCKIVPDEMTFEEVVTFIASVGAANHLKTTAKHESYFADAKISVPNFIVSVNVANSTTKLI